MLLLIIAGGLVLGPGIALVVRGLLKLVVWTIRRTPPAWLHLVLVALLGAVILAWADDWNSPGGVFFLLSVVLGAIPRVKQQLGR